MNQNVFSLEVNTISLPLTLFSLSTASSACVCVSPRDSGLADSSKGDENVPTCLQILRRRIYVNMAAFC